MNSAALRSHIDAHLIEKALSLTVRDSGDFYSYNGFGETKFSIEKFGWYLLSPEFIEKYIEIGDNYEYLDDLYPLGYVSSEFGVAIYEYQKGNPKILVDLLEKI